ncbi:Coenzyme F420 hydrogenase/dehydrogenase, beta subunit C-terminal domain, partial [bacterium]|nr:Coenzyme F420 hydrogenase/dehydrogenase, beta subunit C-terminal domain [bacterium]
GASGGGLTAILACLLETARADCIMHVGTSAESPFVNEVKLSTTIKEVFENCGSRYSPVAPLERLGEALDSYEKIVVVGRPCDISALKKYSKIDQRINTNIVCTVSFFCAGIPSIKGTYKILNKFGINQPDVTSIRYRGYGWPGKTKVVVDNGGEFSMDYKTSWGRMLGRDLLTRCKVCPDGIGEDADVVMADGWTVDDKGYPTFEEHDGVNAIVARTSKGYAAVMLSSEKGWLTLQSDLTTDKLNQMQPNQFNRRRSVYSRVLAIRLMGGGVPSFDMTTLKKLAIEAGILFNLKQLLGMLKRVIIK